MASVISSLRCLWSVSVALTCCFSSFLLYTASPEEAACRYLTTSRHVAVICPVTRLIQKYIHRCLVMFSVKVFFIIIPSAFFWSFLWFDPVLVCCLLSSPAGPQPLGLIGCFFFPLQGTSSSRWLKFTDRSRSSWRRWWACWCRKQQELSSQFLRQHFHIWIFEYLHTVVEK